MGPGKRTASVAVAAAFVLGAAPAAAASAVEGDAPATVWQQWIMPSDGTDWPQLVASEANLAALSCGTTVRIQNDEYVPEERDRFAADGVLYEGEDYATESQRGALSWFFTEYSTPVCAPGIVTPADPVVVQTTASCVDGAWVQVPGRISLLEAANVRWLFPTDGDRTPSAVIEDVAPGEYTFGAVTSEGNFELDPESLDYIDNGIAYVTVVVNGIDPQDCTVPGPEETEAPAPAETAGAAPAPVESDAPALPATLAATGTDWVALGLLSGAAALAITGGVFAVRRGSAVTR